LGIGISRRKGGLEKEGVGRSNETPPTEFDRDEAQKHANLDSCIIQKGKDIFALALDVVLGQEYRN
jgi:hypothetical protein